MRGFKNINSAGEILGGIVTLTFCLILYVKTLAPTVLWGDPAKLQLFAYTKYLRVWAANHTFFVFLGNLWGYLPFKDYAYGLNLLSAIFAALAVLVVYHIAFRLTGSCISALLSALALAFSHTFWWLAVITESYSLFFLFFAICILSVFQWGRTRQSFWLVIFSISFGLGISSHAVMPLFAPAFLVYFLLEEPRFMYNPKRLLLMSLSLTLGLSLLVTVFIRSLAWYTWQELVYQMTSGSLLPFWRNLPKMIRELLWYPFYLLYQFPGLGFILGIIGAIAQWRVKQKEFVFLLLVAASDVIFASGYMYQRQPEIMVPSYLVYALWIAIGSHRLWDFIIRKIYAWQPNLNKKLIPAALAVAMFCILSVLPPAVYYIMPGVVKTMHIQLIPVRNDIPYRDNDYYFLLPDKSGYYGADRYGREVLESVEHRAIIMTDFTPGAVLMYLQKVKGLRADVDVVNVEADPPGRLALQTVQESYGSRPIYLTSYRIFPHFFSISELSKKYDFIPKGYLFLIVKKQDI